MSSWVNHVKSFSRKHNIPYFEALKHPHIKRGYKSKTGKGGCHSTVRPIGQTVFDRNLKFRMLTMFLHLIIQSNPNHLHQNLGLLTMRLHNERCLRNMNGEDNRVTIVREIVNDHRVTPRILEHELNFLLSHNFHIFNAINIDDIDAPDGRHGLRFRTPEQSSSSFSSLSFDLSNPSSSL